MKYSGQTWTLPIPCTSFPVDTTQMAALVEDFGASHDQQYGYRSDNEALQLVSLGVIGRGIPATPRLPDRVARAQEWITESGERKAFFGPDHGWLETAVLPRAGLGEGAIEGPLIVEEYDTTIVVRPGWRARLDSWNNIVVERT